MSHSSLWRRAAGRRLARGYVSGPGGRLGRRGQRVLRRTTKFASTTAVTGLRSTGVRRHQGPPRASPHRHPRASRSAAQAPQHRHPPAPRSAAQAPQHRHPPGRIRRRVPGGAFAAPASAGHRVGRRARAGLLAGRHRHRRRAGGTTATAARRSSFKSTQIPFWRLTSPLNRADAPSDHATSKHEGHFAVAGATAGCPSCAAGSGEGAGEGAPADESAYSHPGIQMDMRIHPLRADADSDECVY